MRKIINRIKTLISFYKCDSVKTGTSAHGKKKKQESKKANHGCKNVFSTPITDKRFILHMYTEPLYIKQSHRPTEKWTGNIIHVFHKKRYLSSQ